jgi:hypothetical protein
VPDTVPAGRRQHILDSVVIERDGFLFHRHDPTMDQLTTKFTLRAAQLDRWTSLIEARAAWCRGRGINYVMLTLPEKHVVYADKLPVELTPERAGRPVSRAISIAVQAIRFRKA